MNMEIASKTYTATIVDSRERIYRVDSTGSAISAGYSVSLLHNYCAKLPRDEYDLILYCDSTSPLFYNYKFILKFSNCWQFLFS